MPEWLSSIFTFSREISSKVALPVFLAALIVVALPHTYAAQIGLDKFRADYDTTLGFVLVFSGAVLVSNLLWSIGRFLRPWIVGLLFEFNHRAVMDDLTEGEKQLLRPFVRDGATEIHADVNTGAVNLLVQKYVLARASSLAVRYTTFAYVLQPWARKKLRKHPKLVD